MVSGEGEFRHQEGFVDERCLHAFYPMDGLNVVGGHGDVEFFQRLGRFIRQDVGSEGFGELREEYRRSFAAFSRFEVGERLPITFKKPFIGDSFGERLRKRRYDLEVRDR